MTPPIAASSAPVQQHQFSPEPAPPLAPPSAPVEPASDAAPDAGAELRKLERAEQDLSMYAAILGHRPTVCPDAVDPGAEPRRFQLSLHLNLPTRVPLPASLSSLVWRQKDGDGFTRRSSRLQMPRLPKLDGERALVTTWFRQMSGKARKCVDDVLMRLAS
jgi:hypothetical protein